MKVTGFIILLFLPVLLIADEIAVSTFVTGKVFIVQNGITKPLKQHQQINKSDRIITKKGKVEIQIGKNAVIYLNENSQVTLVDFLEKGEQSITSLETTEGKVFSKIIKPLNKESKYEIHSSTHVAGVRGTQFIFSAGNPENEETDIPEGVYVNEGKVQVTDKEKDVTESADANEQIVFAGQEMQKGILEDFIKEKMKIFATLNVMKEENYELLKTQLQSNKSLLQDFKKIQENNN